MTKNTKKNMVFVVMGSGDNGGTLPELTVRVFTSRDHAFTYARELHDQFFAQVSILERELEERRGRDRRNPEGNVTFYRAP